jgi:chromosome segregation ATPase
VREYEEAGAKCVAIKKAQAEKMELQRRLERQISTERKKRSRAIKKCSRLKSIKKMLESEHQEALKTIKKQKEVLTPLSEELATVRRAKQDLEAKWLVQDKQAVDLHNKSMEILRTVNHGTDSNLRYIKKTEKLEQQVRALSAKTLVRQKMTEKIARTIEARDEANLDRAKLHEEVQRLRYENDNFAAREQGRRKRDQKAMESLQKKVQQRDLAI